ncbi:molybdopterin-dependent oxidoreductase [Paraburkholderia sp. MMS20-SJTR3]|uniref:Molybdopterin-dependent oxidoreductase n=1 Tax=Paraburkholderia sejongensis TaxID=2886946 RepID=A0ABS8K3A1_9BURK|nr:molybdopterin-dependent oxidoreductase [Paraburkholderia sp. MMS20-SJTR3]MCC8396635.1 molybdopterin-dependent oxidoreductase [Paraburkholderia sp. MMS20-SJTR3]
MANVIATLRGRADGTGAPGRARWLVGLMLALAACCAYAQQSPALSLDVEGKIANTNDAAHRVYHFNEAQLLALPTHTITTATTWTPRSTFTGPLLADILKAVGASGTEIEFRTFDDYTYTVPVSDCARYGVIVAYAMNGQRLKLSDFGPLFLIYPRDAFPDELKGALGDSKFVWQIKALVVR